MLLRIMVPPVQGVSDNSVVVQGLSMGEAWCVSPLRPHADVWKLIWHKIRDVGNDPCGFLLGKVKAHNSLRVIRQLPQVDRAKSMANRSADEAAKAGARTDAMELARAQAMSEAVAKVGGVLKYFAHLLPRLRDGVHWRDADTLLGSTERHAVRASCAQLPRHELRCTLRSVMRCRRCGRQASTQASKMRLAVSPCYGHAVSSLLLDPTQQWAVSKGHHLMMTGSIVWCCRCGAQTQKRRHLIMLPCRGAIKHAAQRRAVDRLAADADAHRLRFSEASRLEVDLLG